MAKRPGGVMIESPLPTRSQLLPVITKWPELTQKSQLGPMIVTILFVLSMYTFAGDNSPIPYFAAKGIYTSYFIILIAIYLNLATLYFIYRLAGKKKSWLLLVGAAVFTGVFMSTPIFDFALVFFHQVLAGGEPSAKQDFLTRFYKYTVAAGLFEELSKALPIFIVLWWTQRMKPQQREAYGVEEPLDGILIGVASAAGFAIVETLGQYVSNSILSTWVSYAGALMKMHLLPPMRPADAVALMSQVIGCAPGVQLAIPRSLDQAFGHMAYSGYFGYFIGLAAMKPQSRWKILIIGLISAALVHGIWDASPEDMFIVEAAIAVISYAVLAAAILKAREISPRKATLQPSIIFGSGQQVPIVMAAAAGAEMAPFAIALPAPRVETPAPMVVPSPVPAPPRPEGSLTLKIGSLYLTIVAGLRLLSHQLAGLRPQSEGDAVAEITCNPQDPRVLGLKNLSASTWEVMTSQGNRRHLEPGQTVRLAVGTKIDFGSVDGEVV